MSEKPTPTCWEIFYRYVIAGLAIFGIVTFSIAIGFSACLWWYKSGGFSADKKPDTTQCGSGRKGCPK